MRCSNCYMLPKCPEVLVKGLCPKKDNGPKCRKCGRPQEENFCVECYAKKAGNIMKVIDRRENDTKITLTLGEISYGTAFEFVDERRPNHCSTFVKTTVCHTYRRRLHDSAQTHVWAFDVRKGKLCQFNMSNEVRVLEVEFHVIGELK